jgi:1,4-alpha-glucan branching enzyme
MTTNKDATMKHIIAALIISGLLAACAPGIQLNRVKGVRGEYAPVHTADGVRFSIKAPEAELVTIAGNFNGWNSYATELEKGAEGIWSIVIPLQQDRRYYYKFLVDGFWIADPDNPDTVSDGHGGVNSIIHAQEGK